jgi:hypothetical protein
MRRSVALLCLFLFCLPRAAEANGRFPTANQLVRHPTDPSRMLLRATFGLLVTRDAAKTWDWVCEQGIGYSSSSDPAIAYTAGGTMVFGISTGIATSTDGCQWTLAPAPAPAKYISDVTVRPEAPHSIFALEGAASDMGGYETALFLSNDDARTWAPIFSFDRTLLGLSVEVGGALAPARVYVTATRNAGDPKNETAVLLVSDDDGKSFVERPIPIEPSWMFPDGGIATKETGVYIAAVDPSAPDRIYVRTNSGADPAPLNPYNRLLVSEDAGKTWKTIYTGKALRGFALTPDGSKIFVGGNTDGVNVASRADYVFQKTYAGDIECLASFDPQTLWACSTRDYGLGTSDDDGRTFKPVLQLGAIHGSLACDAKSSVGSQCPANCAPVRDLLMAKNLCGTPATPGSGGCGCDASAQNGNAVALGIAALALALWRSRRDGSGR